MLSILLFFAGLLPKISSAASADQKQKKPRSQEQDLEITVRNGMLNSQLTMR